MPTNKCITNVHINNHSQAIQKQEAGFDPIVCQPLHRESFHVFEKGRSSNYNVSDIRMRQTGDSIVQARDNEKLNFNVIDFGSHIKWNK